MGRVTASLIFSFWLTFAAAGEAAYVIKLKNGKEFITGRYWHEGKQVMFDTYGGVFGIDKAFVTKIEPSDKSVRLAATAQEVAGERPQPDATATTEKKEPGKPPAPVEAKRDDDAVQKEFNALKAQSGGLETMLTAELSDYMKKVGALKAKIQLDRKINQYIREYTELITMADAAEAALKSRR